MSEIDFEGTLVLEKIAAIGKLDAFLEAIDSDDFGRLKALMKRAGVDVPTIKQVLREIEGEETLARPTSGTRSR